MLWVLRFYGHSLFGTPFGDSIFLLVKKDRGERHAKGLQSRPLESCFYTGVRRGDVLASYEFAVMQLTRFRPTRWRAPHCFHRVQLYCKCRLYGTAYDFPWHPQHAERMEAVRSHAMRDLIAS